MALLHVIWDLDDDPDGNVQHIAEHGITKKEVLDVLERPETYEVSRSTGRPAAIGTTSSGRTIIVVFDKIDEDTVYPVTAFDLEED